MRSAHEDDVAYEADVSDMRQVDEHAVLLQGRVRYTAESGGFADVERFWLYVVVDGLLYRSAVFVSANAAIAEYEAQGITLGVD
jgi:hypothetical protein